MDVNECYRLMSYCVAKNRSQGYLSPDDFNLVINQGQRMYLDFLLGEYQKYLPQRPIAVVEFGQNERIRDSIAPLIYNTILPINSTTGISSYPSDYEYVDNMFGVYGSYNIRFIQQDRQDSYLHSVIDPIIQNPVYLIRHEGFQFFPDRPYGENQARMSYVRKPPSIVWGEGRDSNDRPVWNPATSQNPIWSETDILQVIMRALQLVGVNLQLGVVIQYANEIKTQGQ
ncbi:MAG: hypothetical protein V4538_15230 [Bacteroidota bacterium]